MYHPWKIWRQNRPLGLNLRLRQVTVKTILIITFINWSLYSPWPLKVFQPTNQFHCAPTTTLTLLTTKTTPSIATIWTTQTAQALQHSTVVATGHCWQKSCCQQKVQCHLPLVASMWHVVKALSNYRSIIAEFIPDIRFDQMQPQDTLAPNPAKFKMGFGAVRNKTSSFPTTLFWTGAPTPIVVSRCSSVLPQIGKKYCKWSETALCTLTKLNLIRLR